MFGKKRPPKKKYQNPQNGGGSRDWRENYSKPLENDFIDNEFEKDVIRQELRKIFEESKQVLHDYKPYTDEDELVACDEDEQGFRNAYDDIKGMTAKLASYLEQSLRTLSRSRIIYNNDKGDLNVQKNAAVIAKSLQKNIFSKKVKGISLDTSISILIDESGSIGSTCYEFRKIVIAMAEVFERIGVKFEVLGHTTGYGAQNIDQEDTRKFTRTSRLILFEHKNFNERYQAEKYRLGSIGSFSANLDGEALLATFKRNVVQKTTRHVIFVFSDGLPNDGETPHEILYRNLTDVVSLSRDSGVEVYAFGIQTREPEKFYGSDNFIYIDRVDKLSEAFFRKLAEVITFGRKQ